ncbi:hypothetical protein BHM03_00002770 [Ensete ventricosum]|nr:hypothetical protein BHM03_00002770 [Ensete ventricosum]
MSESETSDFTLRHNANLIVGGTSPGTHHPCEGLSLQEQLQRDREEDLPKVATQAEHPHATSLDYTVLGPSYIRVLNPVVLTSRTWRRTYNIFDARRRVRYRKSIQRLSTLGKMSLSRCSQPRGEPFNPRFHSLCHSGNASINYPLYLAAHPTVELTTSGNLPAPDKSRLRRPTPSMICPIFPKVGSGPLGGVARRPAPAPSALEHSLPDPDILSLNYTNSLREQLRLVNQRIDDVCKTLRTKDECGKSPLCGSPFVQEIQDAPIPPHFRLSMLEAYDSSSDPMEHMATFHVQMTLYRTLDIIMYWAFSSTL